jgi:hypothetical protein
VSAWKYSDDSPRLPRRRREHHGEERDYHEEQREREQVERPEKKVPPCSS